MNIEFDHNATTPPDPRVIDAMARAMRETWHNPSSVHRAGQAARHAVELARASLARLIGAEPKAITLTSSGTEAIDLALRGMLEALPTPRRVLVTARVEHAAVRELASDLEEQGGAVVCWAPVDRAGLVESDGLARLLDDRRGVLSVQWANNETGAIQPIEEAARLARQRGWLVHCDATQWVGKMPASVLDERGSPWLDALTFAPHKFNGPKGVGVLWLRRGVGLRPRIHGTQEHGRRGGTENVPAIVGAGVAADIAIDWLRDAGERERLASLRDEFESLVLAACPIAVVNGPRDRARRLWNTSNIGFAGREAEPILLALSERGVNASAGAACSSGSLEPSPVLLAMGVPEAVAHGSVRFSIGRGTTRDEALEAARVVASVVG